MILSPQEEYLFAALGASGKYAKIIKEIWPQCEIGALRSGKNVDSSDLVHFEFVQVQEAICWNPSAAIIASPANLHVKQALNLVRNNIPTLIEKPIGTGDETIDELNELEQLSKRVPVYLAYILRQDPGADLVKEFISEGMVGKIISARFSCGSWLPDWRSPIDYRQCVSARSELGGGATLELSHEIDMALYLLGDINIIHAEHIHISNLDIDTDDQCVILGRTKALTLVTIEVDFCTGTTERSVKIRGTEASIDWDLVRGIVSFSKKGEQKVQREIGISAEQRMKKQLDEFWTIRNSNNVKLCSVNEGISVLNVIQKVRKL